MSKVAATTDVIAIDGPAGAGKSVVSARVAAALGYPFLDSGAFYRAATLLAIRRGVDLGDEDGLACLAGAMDVRLLPPTVADGRYYTVHLDGEDVTLALFAREIDRSVSRLAAQPAVRAALLPIQRGAASEGAVVAGRDIGTVVFPDARLKVYLVASPEVRARRRLEQLAQRGLPADCAGILAEIRRRDSLDSEREAAPLRRAPDAVLVDTDLLTVEQVVDRILQLWRERAVDCP